MGEQSVDFRDVDTYSYKYYRDTYEYLAGFSILIMGVVIGAVMFNDGYGTNVYTELLSVVATIAILDRRSERREQRRHERETKIQLIRAVAGTDNATSLKALREIEDRNWFQGAKGILQGAYLKNANLAGANLLRANLKGAYLMGATLTDANLWDANLADADLVEANLSGANLTNSNLECANLQVANLQGADLGIARLEGANLQVANLQGADLRYANLGGANMQFANLEGAALEGVNLQGACLNGAHLQNAFVCVKTARFSAETSLPNGEKWTADTDMTQFGCFVDATKYAQWRESQLQSDNL